jgi:DNA-binding transcriptional LysR family regulator
MEMHQLEYVLAVAKYKNFTRASEVLKTSQSSLSQQIIKLENELGISLFVRTTRSVELSPAGEEFVKHARRIMSEVIEARRCIHEYTSFEKGNLTVGIIPVVGHYRLPNLFSSYKKSFPRVILNLLERQCKELIPMLNSHEIDAAFVHQTIEEPNLQFTPLITDQMVIVTSERHPFAARKSINIKELEYEKFIVPPPTSGYNQDFQKACRSAEFEPEIILTCSSVKTILGLVREDLGVAALPAGVASMDWGFGTKNLELKPAINSTIFLATRNKDLLPTLKEFIKFTSKWTQKQINPDHYKFIPFKLSISGQKLKSG